MLNTNISSKSIHEVNVEQRIVHLFTCVYDREKKKVNHKILQITNSRYRTSKRKSSTDAAENVGTKSAPFTTEVIKSLPDSASSQVIHAAAMIRQNEHGQECNGTNINSGLLHKKLETVQPILLSY